MFSFTLFNPANMPSLAAWIGKMLLGIGPSFASSILGRLGIGVATFYGVSALVDTVRTQIFAAFSGVDPTVIQLFGVLQVGTCINILLSAVIAKLTIKGLSGDGSLKKILAG